jgi:hypothetical protein
VSEEALLDEDSALDASGEASKGEHVMEVSAVVDGMREDCVVEVKILHLPFAIAHPPSKYGGETFALGQQAEIFRWGFPRPPDFSPRRF